MKTTWKIGDACFVQVGSKTTSATVVKVGRKLLTVKEVSAEGVSEHWGHEYVFDVSGTEPLYHNKSYGYTPFLMTVAESEFKTAKKETAQAVEKLSDFVKTCKDLSKVQEIMNTINKLLG